MRAARDALMAGLRTVEGLRVRADLSNPDPPCLVVGPPRLTPDAMVSPELTQASFVVALVARADERALDLLLDRVQDVCDAVWTVDGAVVTECTPGTWPAGAAALPAYLIEVDMSLEG
ncbi:MAG: hypothetical protein ACRCZP_05780 [Phycicoccus sp.]